MEYLHQQPPQLRTGKIAGQERKVFADKAGYGKISEWAYQSLSAFIHRGIAAYPARVCRAFQSKRAALPGYAIEGEERRRRPTAEKAAPTAAEPPQDTEQRKERETINEQFSILIDSRSRFETGKPGGVWLPCRPQQSSFMRLWKASALPQTIRRIFSSTGILLRRTAL